MAGFGWITEAHKLLIPRKLLICRLLELASIDWQSRYSNSASWQRLTSSKTDETGEIRFVENGERASNLRCVEQPTLRTQRGSGGPMVKA